MTATVEITALEALKAEVMERLEDRYYLVHAYRGDTLPEDVVEALTLDLDPWETDGGQRLCEWESERRYEGVVYEINSITDEVLKTWERRGATDETLKALEADWEHSDEWESVRFEMEDRDVSPWFQELIASHGPVLLRVPVEGLGEGEWSPDFTPEGSGDYYNEDGDLTQESYAELRKLLGLPWHETSLNELVRDVPSDVYMGYWLFAADLEDLIEARRGEHVEIKGATLLMGNPYTGAYAESVKTYDAVVKSDDISSDKGAFGYSWTATTGGVTVSSYTVDSIKGVKA